MTTGQESLVHPVYPTSAYPPFFLSNPNCSYCKDPSYFNRDDAPLPLLCEFSGKGSINEWRSHRSAQVWMHISVFLSESQIQAFTTVMRLVATGRVNKRLNYMAFYLLFSFGSLGGG